MVKLSIEARDLILHIRGWSQLWVLKRRLRVPLTAVQEVKRVPSPVTGWWKGWRMPGIHIPRVIVAGTFYRATGREFWDVRRGNEAVEIRLTGAQYERVVVDVEDPKATVAMINEALGRPPKTPLGQTPDASLAGGA